MARAATTTDAFNAIAEPRRREIVSVLAEGGPIAVNELVRSLGLPQPVVSKHLGVLRDVGIVSVARRGRQRLYSLEPASLRPIHDWVSRFEKFWEHNLDRLKERAEQKARALRAREAPGMGDGNADKNKEH